jgi:hypothetical protein
MRAMTLMRREIIRGSVTAFVAVTVAEQEQSFVAVGLRGS